MRQGLRLVAAGFVLLFALLATSVSRASSGASLVAVVTPEPNASLTRRVQAELKALGLDVLVLKPPDEDTVARASLERAARSVGAIAAIRLVPGTEGHVEVWVADRVTGKAVVRELDAGDAGASDAAVAVESVELLRASLMELHSGEPARGEVPPTEEVQALALRPVPRPTPPWLGLSVAGGAELGVRGIGPSADAELSLWVRLASRFGARLLGGVSVAPSHAVTAAGSVDVRSQIAGAMATFDLAGAESAWIPSVSLGAGAAHVSAAGTATPPYRGASEDAWAGATMAGAGIAWRFAHDLRLRADGVAVWTLPGVHVQTPAGDVGWWGAPALLVSLGLEVMWRP